MRSIYDMFPSIIEESKKHQKRYIIVFIKKDKHYLHFDNICFGYEYTNFDTIIIALRKSGMIFKFVTHCKE